MKTLTIEQLFQKQKTLGNNEMILDVRSPEEFSEGHVPGAKNISHDEVSGHSKELKNYQNIYMYCRSGGRCQMALADLEKAGVKNVTVVVNSGMPDWIRNGFPIEK